MQIANLGEFAKKVITILGSIFKSKMFVIYYYFSLMYIKVRIIEFKKIYLDQIVWTPRKAYLYKQCKTMVRF